MSIPAQLGARLMELAEKGQLKAGTGTQAIDAARAETETVRRCQELARLARRLAFMCDIRAKAVIDASRAAAEEQIEGVWRELLASRQGVQGAANAGSGETAGPPRVPGSASSVSSGVVQVGGKH